VKKKNGWRKRPNPTLHFTKWKENKINVEEDEETKWEKHYIFIVVLSYVCVWSVSPSHEALIEESSTVHTVSNF